MNFNIYIAAMICFAFVSTSMARDQDLNKAPPVEPIKGRKVNLPPPLIPDSGSTERVTTPRANDPRGQGYINVFVGGATGRTAAPEVAKRQIPFCSYLAMVEDSLTRPIDTGITSANFTSGNSRHVYHLLGSAYHNRTDGRVPAFVYESTTGSFFALKPTGPNRAEFVIHNIPNDLVITDIESYKGRGFWTETRDGEAPLCGRYINLVRN